jgi:predicted Rossmann fold flavoprotein
MKQRRFVVVGGGASGIFAAIAAARKGADVTVLEATTKPLRKVILSGGGRCNVLHRPLSTAKDLISNYPRGKRALLGLFTSRWTQKDTYDWFEREGVALKVEADGRCFPTTDDSTTVSNALLAAAEDAGVRIVLGARVESIDPSPWTLRYRLKRARGAEGAQPSHETIAADAVMLATGSAPVGYALCRDLGLDVVAPIPSLFSFRLEAGHALEGLQGVALRDCELSFARAAPRREKRITQRGPLLVTHNGVSGPAALRLSSFAALELSECGYSGALRLAVVPGLTPAKARAVFRAHRESVSGKSLVKNSSPFETLPRRVWGALSAAATGDSARRWADLRKEEEEALVRALTALELPFRGKDSNKDEFVTAGGVALSEINTRSMEAKNDKLKGLYFAGEVLNVDGVTGGFNFQACWSGGHIAGEAAARDVGS